MNRGTPLASVGGGFFRQNLSHSAKGFDTPHAEYRHGVICLAVKNRLRDIRFEYKMDQNDFANFLGIHQSQYNRYENQLRQPSLEIALIISDRLKRTVNEIFFLEK